jgi:hypothetical protein
MGKTVREHDVLLKSDLHEFNKALKLELSWSFTIGQKNLVTLCCAA